MEIKSLFAELLPEYAEVIRKSFATVAQDWYAENGFVYTETKKYEGLQFTVVHMKYVL